MSVDPIQTPNHWDNWQPRRQRRWMRKNAGPGLTMTPPPQAGNVPQHGTDVQVPPPQNVAADFAPLTPQFEAGRRGLDDQYSATMQALINAQNQIQPNVDLQNARMNTDQGYANRSLDEQLSERGIFQSGINPTLRQRDIQIPFGRQRQDLALGADAQYADLASQMDAAALAYNSGLAELQLNNAADAFASQPLNVPMYSQNGPRDVRPPRRNQNGRNGNGGGRNGGGRNN